MIIEKGNKENVPVINNIILKRETKKWKMDIDISQNSWRVLYASPPVWKLHPQGDIISKSYKPAFHSSHLSHNMSYGSAATLQVFCLLQQRYSYSTQSSMMELLLLVSQHWNLCLG